MKHKYVIYLNCNNALDILVIIVNCKFCSFLKLYDLHYLVLIFWRVGLSDTILKGTRPRTIPARFGLIWFRSFRGEDLNVKVYDVRRQTPSDGKSSHGLWPGELKMNYSESLSKLCPTALPSIQDGCCY
jgi:hypothetical protein